MGFERLKDLVYEALNTATRQLKAEYPTHSFYYLTLTTTGEAVGVGLAAWSSELLQEATASAPEDVEWLKWSYADSPLYPYAEAAFEPVNAELVARHQELVRDFEAEVDLRLDAMTEAMAALDASGAFGTGHDRAQIVLAVEVMPPDHTNAARVMRLNPAGALVDWLAEAAEPEG